MSKRKNRLASEERRAYRALARAAGRLLKAREQRKQEGSRNGNRSAETPPAPGTEEI